MPDVYILEMVADWIGASEVYGGDYKEWILSNISNFKFGNPYRVSEIVSAICGFNTSIIYDLIKPKFKIILENKNRGLYFEIEGLENFKNFEECEREGISYEIAGVDFNMFDNKDWIVTKIK